MVLKSSIEINAPINKVFKTFTDLSNLNKYVDSITNVEITKGGDTMKLGSKWKETRMILDEEVTLEMEVVMFIENKLLEVSTDFQETKYRSLYTFTDEGMDRTLVDLVYERQPYGFFSKLLTSVNKLFKSPDKKDIEKDLQDYKRAIEESEK